MIRKDLVCKLMEEGEGEGEWRHAYLDSREAVEGRLFSGVEGLEES